MSIPRISLQPLNCRYNRLRESRDARHALARTSRALLDCYRPKTLGPCRRARRAPRRAIRAKTAREETRLCEETRLRTRLRTRPKKIVCYNFNRTEVHEQKKNIQWFKKKYCDGEFRKEVRKYFQEYIKPEGGCETKDEETGDAGTRDIGVGTDEKQACCTC